jgi:hypothetical protein
MCPHPFTTEYLGKRPKEELLREAARSRMIGDAIGDRSSASSVSDIRTSVRRARVAFAAVGSIARWSQHPANS